MSNPSGGAKWEARVRRCLLWHSWGAWAEHVKGSGSIVQVRRCLNCNQAETRTITLKHAHDWEMWSAGKGATLSNPWSESQIYVQHRFCRTCGELDMRTIDPRNV